MLEKSDDGKLAVTEAIHQNEVIRCELHLADMINYDITPASHEYICSDSIEGVCSEVYRPAQIPEVAMLHF